MEVLRTIWLFIQNEVLGMKWLNNVIGSILAELGLDITTRLGGSVQFFCMMSSKSRYCSAH